jgi:hypothetical protein
MPTSDNWEFVFLLHNLELKEAFESEFIAIVPNDDPRLHKIASDVPCVAALVRKFTDQQGKPKYPCALIVRNNRPSYIGSLEAIISFRNIFALSCLLYGWPRTIGSLNVFFPLWSDFFDFYPTSLTRDAKFLHTLSPATNGAFLPENFEGQVSPNLHNAKYLRFQPDDKILSLLICEWKKEFAEPNSSDWKRQVLFRSLEMAYHAAKVPSNSRPTIFDFGPSIALWVSAFEVLVHPGGKDGRADIKTVINLLRQFSWRNLRLKQTEHQIKIGGKPEYVNLVQKLYGELNEARNDFLHGNPVVPSRLFCFCNEHRRLLIEIAPLIYKVALSCFFGQFGYAKGKKDEQPNYKELFDGRGLEKALLATLEDLKQ